MESFIQSVTLEGAGFESPFLSEHEPRPRGEHCWEVWVSSFVSIMPGRDLLACCCCKKSHFFMFSIVMRLSGRLQAQCWWLWCQHTYTLRLFLQPSAEGTLCGGETWVGELWQEWDPDLSQGDTDPCTERYCRTIDHVFMAQVPFS